MNEAFELLARREREGLVGFARGMLADGHEAEDAAQEALLRLYRAWGRAENPRAFLYKTIANLCIDRLRQHALLPPPGGSVAIEPGVVAAVRAELDERAAAVRAAIEELPADERAAVLLKEVERLSYAEIAVALDATVAQVTNWIHRGKNRLRRKLAPYVEEGEEAMNCSEIRELLVCYDDGELGVGEVATVEQHLAGCPGCARELYALRGTMRMVGDYLAGPKPVTSAARPPVVRVARRPLVPVLAAAAALVLAAAVGWLALRPASEASAAEITRRALAVLESHKNLRYRIIFLLEDGKTKPAGELVVEPGGRSLMRYTYTGIEFIHGQDGKESWFGTISYPGDPGSFKVRPAGKCKHETIVGQGQVPDFQEWLKSLKEDGSRLTILAKEKLDGRECTVIRSEPPADWGLPASATFWVDDQDRSIRRVEDKVPVFMSLRLDLDTTDVAVADDFYSLSGHSTTSSRIVRVTEEEKVKDQAGQ